MSSLWEAHPQSTVVTCHLLHFRRHAMLQFDMDPSPAIFLKVMNLSTDLTASSKMGDTSKFPRKLKFILLRQYEWLGDIVEKHCNTAKWLGNMLQNVAKSCVEDVATCHDQRPGRLQNVFVSKGYPRHVGKISYDMLEFGGWPDDMSSIRTYDTPKLLWESESFSLKGTRISSLWFPDPYL